MVEFQPDGKIKFIQENATVPVERIRQSIASYFVNVNSSSVLSAFPSALMLARASNIAYENRWLQEPDLLKEWDVLCSATNEENEYFGRALISKSNQPYRHIIITHRGTDLTKPGAVVADYNGIMHNEITGQINSACTFVLNIIEILKDVMKNVDNITYVQLSITGHSLGGWLAQLTTYAAKHIKINDQNKFMNCTETEGMHAHCEVFDSPGAMPMLKRLNRNIITKQYYKLELIRKLDITVYLGTPNLVNIINEQAGRIVQIELKDTKTGAVELNISHDFVSKCKKIFMDKIFQPEILSSVKYHDISKFIEALREQTPKYSIENWPMVIFKNWDTLPGKKEYAVTEIFKWYPTPGLIKLIKIYGELLVLGKNIRFRPESLKGFDEFIKYLEQNLSNSPPFFHKEITNDPIVSLNIFLPHEDEFIRDICWWSNYFEVDNQEINESFRNILEEIRIKNCDLERRLIALKSIDSLDTIINILRTKIFKAGRVNLELPNHSELKLFDRSNEYIRKLHNEYLNVDINPNVVSVDTLRNIEVSQVKLKIHSNPDISKLEIKLIRCNILNHLTKAFPGKFLIVQPNDLIPEIKITSKKIKLVVIDCLSSLSEAENIPNLGNPHLRIVQLKSEITNETEKFKIQITNNLLTDISKQRVSFQGNVIEFGSLFIDLKLDSFQNYFNNQLSKFEKLITNNDRVYEMLSIGLPPPSFFKEMSNYVDVNESLSLREFMKTFQKPNSFFIFGDLKAVNDFISRVTTNTRVKPRIDDGSLVFQLFSLNHEYNDEDLSNKQKLDDKALQEFFEMVEIKNNYGQKEYVNMIKCSKSSSEKIEWKLQFNPYLYQERKFNPALYKERKFKIQDKIYDETQFLDYFVKSGKSFIVADEPGMGKSTTIRKLAEAFYDKNSRNFLVLWIDLKTIKFSQNSDQITLNTLFDLLSTNIPENDFTKYFLKYKLNMPTTNGVCVFLDGFDEVDSNYKDHLASLFKMSEEKLIKFIVTTRFNQDDLEKLQKALPKAVFSVFEKLSEYQEFLTSFLTGIIQNKDYVNKIKAFSEQTVTRTNKYMSGMKDKNFLGVPLQLRILSEVQLKHLRIYIQKNSFNDLPDYNLWYLYNEYINRKYEIYFQHKILPKIESKYHRNEIISGFERRLEFLSVTILFDSKERQLLLGTSEVIIDKILRENNPAELCRTGIVRNFVSLDFLHRTFAEFYFAKFILRTLQKIISKNRTCDKKWVKDVWAYLLKEVFFQFSNMSVVKPFFNDLIAKELAKKGSILQIQLTNDHESRRVNLRGEEREALALSVKLGIDDMLPKYTFFILNAVAVDHQWEEFWKYFERLDMLQDFILILMKKSEREEVFRSIVNYLRITSCVSNGTCDCAVNLIMKWFTGAEKYVRFDVGSEFIHDLLLHDDVITYYKDKWLNNGSGRFAEPFKRVTINMDNEQDCFDNWRERLQTINDNENLIDAQIYNCKIIYEVLKEMKK